LTERWREARATGANVKRSVSVAIHDAAGRVLLVQRPPDDEDLALAWGLPAATLRAGESWEGAVERAARDKLGVDVVIGARLAEGDLDRPGYRLQMRLYDASIARGVPAVPQKVPGVTQYVAWRWGPAADLEAAARAGSLCSRLYLEWATPP
jgi:ADP-ribose pyrophosphatase YjhB (NUDIX family)